MIPTGTVAPTSEREPEPRGRTDIMSNTALTRATYDVDGGQQLVVARTTQ